MLIRHTPHYGVELARVHHERFGMVARGAARELLARLAADGVTAGTVVDLAAGSGLMSRAVVDAGFRAWGVDISGDMLALARAECGADATFMHGSLWDVDLPRCVAAAAVGEAFCYAVDPAAGLTALAHRLGDIHAALEPGGWLIFDVAGPGRSGPGGERRGFWSDDRAPIGLHEAENLARRQLTRAITVFAREGELYRRVDETHVLQLYSPDEVEAALQRAGFAWERLPRYGELELPPGWHAYVARKLPASLTPPGP